MMVPALGAGSRTDAVYCVGDHAALFPRVPSSDFSIAPLRATNVATRALDREPRAAGKAPSAANENISVINNLLLDLLMHHRR